MRWTHFRYALAKLNYIIILNSIKLCFPDEAMHILYNNGVGEVYITMVKWLDSPNYHLLTTAVLAIGNFARQDDYCTQMMQDKIFDKLLGKLVEYNRIIYILLI